MQHIKHKLILSLMLLLSLSVFSQSQSLNFSFQSDTIEIDGDIIDLDSTIKKQGNQLIWTQYVGDKERISTSKIITKNENWNKTNNLGEIVYSLEENGYQSTLTISGDSNGITVTFSLVTSNGQNENYVFKINTVTYN